MSEKLAQDMWADSEIQTLRARVKRLEEILEANRALSDQRARELELLRAQVASYDLVLGSMKRV